MKAKLEILKETIRMLFPELSAEKIEEMIEIGPLAFMSMSADSRYRLLGQVLRQYNACRECGLSDE